MNKVLRKIVVLGSDLLHKLNVQTALELGVLYELENWKGKGKNTGDGDLGSSLSHGMIFRKGSLHESKNLP